MRLTGRFLHLSGECKLESGWTICRSGAFLLLMEANGIPAFRATFSR